MLYEIVTDTALYKSPDSTIVDGLSYTARQVIGPWIGLREPLNSPAPFVPIFVENSDRVLNLLITFSAADVRYRGIYPAFFRDLPGFEGEILSRKKGT